MAPYVWKDSCGPPGEMNTCGSVERKPRELERLTERLRIITGTINDALVDLENFNDRLTGPVPRSCDAQDKANCGPVPSTGMGNLADAIDNLALRADQLRNEVDRASSVA